MAAGLPEPEVNRELRDEHGLLMRLDLCYPSMKLAVEYDGRQHRSDLQQWDHDLERDEWLDDVTWRRLPVFSWGIYKRPDQTLATMGEPQIAKVFWAWRERVLDLTAELIEGVDKTPNPTDAPLYVGAPRVLARCVRTVAQRCCS